MASVREHIRDGRTWLVDADIEQCFDAIPHRVVFKELGTVTSERPILQLVAQWLRAFPNEHRTLGPDRGIPQGMVLSPLLCNLVLHQLDCALERQGIAFVRFADDFVLLTRNEQEAEKSQEVCR